MIALKHTPTRLIDAAQRPQVVLAPVANRVWRARGLENAWRFTILCATLFWLWLTRRLTGRLAGVETRRTLEKLGGLWIKTGQLMALRVDLFSFDFCDELARLQYSAIGFPTDIARAIVERELGEPIEARFDEFGDKPFAVASIGQVFRAHLREEDAWVAVKVQRPYIDELFQRDFSVIHRITRIFDLLGIYRHMRWRQAIREIREIMEEEIDYYYEASHIRRMRRSLKPHRIAVPKPYRRYCTRRVLVTEFVHGVLMADVIKVAREDPKRLSEWLRENNVNPRQVARRLTYSLFRQMLEDNLYHGDLHPGNIVLMRDSRVALIDFGTTSFTEREYLERFRLFVHALAQRDYSKAADLLFLMSPRLPMNIDLDNVKEQMVQTLRSWTRRTLVRELPYHVKSLENITIDLIRVMHDNRCPLEWAFLRFHRAFTTLDMSLIHLHPDVNYPRMLQKYFYRADLRSMKRLFTSEVTIRAMGAYRNALEIQERVGEYTMFQGNLVRRHAQLFEGATNKFASFLASVTMMFAAAALIVEGLGLLVFLEQRYPARVRSLIGPGATAMADRTPRLDTSAWVLLMFVVGYFSYRFWRTAAKLREKGAVQRQVAPF
jgi:ubiquinone biosynthesis protein